MTQESLPPRVGKYQLVDRVAIGGMAEVYLACERGELALDRLLVIKRILPHLAEDQTFVRMFLYEARLAARIQHPNVVQIYELGEADGFPFMAMEYVPGSTIKALVKAANRTGDLVSIGAAIEILSQACAGAHAAHELRDPSGSPVGLVHRDLTPHNLMVTDTGLVKLLDFGIAKASQAQARDLTRTGMLKGKISYMSPEQCKQHDLDRRSDVFTLGVCAWELLTGEKPFTGQSELETMQRIVRGQRAEIQACRPDLPAELAEAVHTALAIDPDARWPTAEAFRAALREAARVGEIQAHPDQAAETVTRYLGHHHQAQRAQVDAALERTLITLSKQTEIDDRPVTEESRTSLPANVTSVAVGALGTAALGSAGLLAVAAVAILALLANAWSHRPEPRPAGEPVPIALAPTVSEAVAVANMDPVRHYLEQALGQPFDLHVADSYDQATARLIRRDVDYALLPHRATLAALDSEPRLQILATKIMDGTTSTDGYLLVHRESTVQQVSDLRGQTLCFVDPESNTGHVLPRAALRAAGLDPDVDVAWVESGDHTRILTDLLAGRCTGGGTYSLNFHGAEKKGIQTAQLRILTITGSTPHDHVLAHPDADPALTRRIEAALLAFSPQDHLGVDAVGETERLTGFTDGHNRGRP